MRQSKVGREKSGWRATNVAIEDEVPPSEPALSASDKEYDKPVLAWAYDKAIEKALNNQGWTDDEKAELLRRMNEEHAVVEYGGKVLYSRHGTDSEGRQSIEFMTHENMRHRYAAILVGGSHAKRLSAFDIWSNWSWHVSWIDGQPASCAAWSSKLVGRPSSCAK